MKEISKLAYEHESHVRSCPLCEANADHARRVEGAIDAALHELGVVQPGYPAPVANAIAILSGRTPVSQAVVQKEE